MKLLHTADWHIGKTLKGRNRLDEQRQVIAQIIAVAREHQPDAVLIAGDLYDMSAPSAEAQQLVVQALLALARPARRSSPSPGTTTAPPLSTPTGR